MAPNRYGKRGKKQMDDTMTSLDQEVFVTEDHYGNVGDIPPADEVIEARAAESEAGVEAAVETSTKTEQPPASPSDRKGKGATTSLDQSAALEWSPARAAAVGSHKRAKEGVEKVDERAQVFTNETVRALEYPEEAEAPAGEVGELGGDEDEEEDLVEL
jgi:hypothetical protein